jgi:hypothetical protein
LLVPHSQLLVGYGAVAICDLATGLWFQTGPYPISAPVAGPNIPYVMGLASITPQVGLLLPPRPGPVPPISVPQTYILTATVNPNVPIVDPAIYSVLAASPSLDEPPNAAPMATAISLPTGFSFVAANCLAVYQKSPPPGEAYLQPPPVYVYVLGIGVAGGVILRYQMTAKLPYAPAGSTADPTDPTFIATPQLTNDSPAASLACSPGGILAVSNGISVCWYNAETGALAHRQIFQIENIVGYTVAYGPDGALYTLAGVDPSSQANATLIQKTVGFAEAFTYSLANIQGLQSIAYGSAMTVGGGSAAPVIYICTPYDEGAFNIATIDGNSLDGTGFGSTVPNTIQTYNGAVPLPPRAIGLTTFYTYAPTPPL